MRYFGRTLRALLAGVALLGAVPAARAGEGDADEVLLRREGLEPDARAIRGYLRTLYPDARRRRLAKEYAARLGEREAARRGEAAMLLAAMRTAPLRELKRAAESTDPEVRRLASGLLDEALGNMRADVLLAALGTIARRRLPGLTHDLLEIAPLCAELFALPSLHRAVRAGARPEDAPLLRGALQSTEAETRRAAILGLGAILERKDLDELYPLLESPDESVRATAAWALGDRGDRACLPVFGALLDAEDAGVRRQAVRALRHISGKVFGYASYTDRDARRGPADAWRRWLATHTDTVRWTYPLAPIDHTFGRTLISLFNDNRVIELDEAGRKVWELRGVTQAWAVRGLPNGHRLVVLYGNRTLVEYDAAGKQIWRQQLPYAEPGSVRRLPNGNMLLAFTRPGSVVELRSNGTIAHETKIPGNPTDAQLLSNGRLLVCLGRQKRVVEVERRTGRVLWSLDGFRYPYSASRLSNGNTLVTDFGAGKVAEFDGAGKVVWEIQHLKQCYGAQRLASGRTLVADASGVREVERNGTVHWLFRGGTFMRAVRY